MSWEYTDYKTITKNFAEIMRSGVDTGRIALADLAVCAEDLLKVEPLIDAKDLGRLAAAYLLDQGLIDPKKRDNCAELIQKVIEVELKLEESP